MKIVSDTVTLIGTSTGYLIRWHKCVQAGDAAIPFLQARFAADILPDHPAVSGAYYYSNPLALEGMKVRAFDSEGHPLHVDALRKDSSNLEVAIRLQRSDNGDFVP